MKRVLNTRNLLAAALVVGAAQAALAAGHPGAQAARSHLALSKATSSPKPAFVGWCGGCFEPPYGRNGWQPAAAAKALPQSAAVQAPAGGMTCEPPTGRNGWQPATQGAALPQSAAGQSRLPGGHGL